MNANDTKEAPPAVTHQPKRQRITRRERHAHNRAVMERVARMCPGRYASHPSYRRILETLQREGWTTPGGKPYTMRALYRMMQREGVSGIWGVCNGQHLAAGEGDAANKRAF